ncbi:MAG TPA: hypothetical protein VIU64_12820 [Polyangia bacterium]
MLKTRLSMALVLATSTLFGASCDSGDTIVAVNYSFDDATAASAKMNAASLHITIKPASGSEVTDDVAIMHDADSGAITTASYRRVKVNGMSGKATVTVVAKDSSGAELMKAIPADPALVGDPAHPNDLEIEVDAHGAVAAFVTFAKPVVPMPDAGASEAGASGSGGSASGSGGSGGADGSGSGGSGSGGSGG